MRRSEQPEGHDTVARIVADPGAAEPANPRPIAPEADDLLLGLAEIGVVFRNVGAQAEAQTGDAPHARIGADVEHRPVDAVHMLRSEERRVGKECRSRWSPYH